MDTQLNTAMSSFVYNRIPTKVSRKDFNRYIDPHLKRPKTGPTPKLSLYKIFNYILYLTVRANFREKIRIEISSWNERTHHNHPRANRRYSGHHRLSTEDACGRIDRQTLPDQCQLDVFESGTDV